MPRPRSEDRRNAILSAATRVIAAEGLGAATAAIAKDAGVSNGSLFAYFGTKAVLLNELYVALKTEMGAVAVAGLPIESSVREQVLHCGTSGCAGPHRSRKSGGRSRSFKSLMTSPPTVTGRLVPLSTASRTCSNEAGPTGPCGMRRSGSS